MARRRGKAIPRTASKPTYEGTDDAQDGMESSKKKEFDPPPAPFYTKQTMTPIKIFASDSLDSSTDVCEVEWDARSPITMSQVARYKHHSVDTSELVKNYVEERDLEPSEQPALNLWRDQSDSDDGTSGQRYRAQRYQRGGRGRRQRGRPSGLKSVTNSKEILLQLESVLRTKPVGDDMKSPKALENQRKSPRVALRRATTEPSTSSTSTCPSDHSFDLFESTQQPFATSTQKLPLQAKQIAQTFKPTLPHSPILPNKLKSPLAEKVINQNSNAANTTPKRPTPVSARKRNMQQSSLNASMDDLWSDEDGLFDNDSFIIKATQGAFDGITPPRMLKRKTPQSSPEVSNANKCGRYTFSLGSTTKIKPQDDIAGNAEGQFTAPFRSYRESQTNSPQRKASGDSPQTAYAKKEFNFAKPRCKSPLVVSSTGPKHSMATQPVHQPSPIVPPSKSNLAPQRNKSPTLLHQAPISNARPTKNTAQLHTGLPITTPTLTKPVQKAPPKTYSFKNASQQPAAAPANKPQNFKNPAPQCPLVPTKTHSFKNTTTIPSKTTNSLRNSAQRVPYVPGIKPLGNPLIPSKTNTVRHSTPQRKPKGVSMDISWTDELLASLAEPDELLDSQMGGDELLDSQTYREVLILSPDPAKDDPIKERKESAGSDTVTAVDKSTAEMAMNMSDDGFDDDFGDDGEELREDELMAMLELVESSQETQPFSNPTSNARPTSTSNGSTTSTVNQSTSSKPTLTKRNPVILPVKTESITQFKAKQPVITKATPSMATLPVRKMEPISVVPFVNIGKELQQPNNGVNTSSPLVPQNMTQMTASQKCTKEEIERKKQEALKRRQNRLKLSRPK